jgi:phosphoribosylanthranilate isomerase
VLVRGINNLSDARYCAGMGADGLIFTLDPSLPGAVDAATVKELAGWVSGVELIGELTSATPYSTINELVQTCGLNRVLLHHGETEEFWKPAELQVPVLMEISQYYIADKYEYEALTGEDGLKQHFPAGYALVAPASHNLSSYDARKRAAEVAIQHQLWLEGSFSPETARQALGLGLAGLILQGGDEIKPGLRDFTELEAIFEALED